MKDSKGEAYEVEYGGRKWYNYIIISKDLKVKLMFSNFKFLTTGILHVIPLDLCVITL